MASTNKDRAPRRCTISRKAFVARNVGFGALLLLFLLGVTASRESGGRFLGQSRVGSLSTSVIYENTYSSTHPQILGKRPDINEHRFGLYPAVRCRDFLSNPMLHIIWSIIVGFIIGLAARAVMPGTQQLGFITTTVVGVVGSILGGLIGRVISRPKPGTPFHAAGFIMSIIGALIVLYLMGRFYHA